MFMIASIILMAGNVIGQTVKTSVDSNRDISKLGRYAWQENRIAARQVPEIVAGIEGALKDAINRELAQKGYVQDPQRPDFFIRVVAGSDYQENMSANVDFRLPTNTTVYTSQNPNGLGVNAWLVVISQFHIMATDPSSDAPVWQAEVTKKYKDTDKAVRNMNSEIDQIVRKALKSFPSRKKTK